jgi:AraC-like DNA-binding protein
MSVIVRTPEVPPTQRLDFWRHVVSDTFVPLDVSGTSGPAFRAEMRGGPLGTIQMFDMSADRHRVLRTPQLISRSAPDLYKLSIQVRGSGLLCQDDREATLGPGDFAIYDTCRPYQMAFDGAFRMLVLVFPHRLLPLSQGQIRQLTAVALSGRYGTGALVSPFLLRLARHLDEYDPASTPRLADNALDLLMTSFAERLDCHSAVPTETRRRALLLRIYAFIDARLDDPGLDPASIAAAVHISSRYLYKLFEGEGLSVAGWIRARRLEHCRRDLLDPLLRHQTVSAIAARWGIADPAQFSRQFRAAFEQTPSEYRQAPLARRLPDRLPASVR